MSVNYSRDKAEDKEVRKRLGQLTPPLSNTPVEIYSPFDNINAVAIMLTITNDSNQDAVATVYYDDSGTTYDLTTRIGQRTISKGAEDAKIGLFLAMNESAGSLAIESDSGGDLTFTLWGVEKPKI